MIYVVGPMSSGNRVLRDVIQSAGLLVAVDRSHGTQDLPDDVRVIVIRRDRGATDASREAHWAGHADYIAFSDSDEGIRSRYPHAPVVWYEDLCDHTEATIRRLADLLGVDPWESPVELVNQNAKWAA